MKILLSHNHHQYYGGAETYVEQLLQLLEKNGHTVYTYTKDSKSIQSIWDKIKTGFGLFWNSEINKELTEFIKKFKPDIAYFCNIYPLIGATAYTTCHNNKIPIIQAVHDYRFMCPKGLLFRNSKICELCVKKTFAYSAIQYNCYHNSKLASLFFAGANYWHRLINSYRLIDRFLFPTEFIRDYHVKNLLIPIQKTKVITSFSMDFKKRKTRDNNQTNNNFFLFVGRLSEEKGIIPLFDLFLSMPKFKLIIIGDGPLKNTLLKRNKSKNIMIKGHLPKEAVHTYMKKALFTIIPSVCWDILPNVLIESFSCGTPVMVPEFGSFPAMVDNDKTGVFYKSGDYMDLRQKIEYYAGKPTLVKKMGINAQESYRERFTQEKYSVSLMNVFNSLTKTKR